MILDQPQVGLGTAVALLTPLGKWSRRPRFRTQLLASNEKVEPPRNEKPPACAVRHRFNGGSEGAWSMVGDVASSQSGRGRGWMR
jgi:hypothetical protein